MYPNEQHPLRHRRHRPTRYASTHALMTRMAVMMSVLFALSMVLSHLSRPDSADAPAAAPGDTLVPTTAR
ncbi:hypothetical protein FO470_06830 [Starkeya sp. 3C]|uniref:Uncharacterized protein n=1 Tax=Ancylobacter moscoviensis TaxID=2597768 RepID=A0ABY3DSD3_9HYPH|nr:hypothetical protein [Ancylobacter moscoviensis]TSJ62718.1 hypothetical protein FO470_06830 [Ancylobacter moscoviensis]